MTQEEYRLVPADPPKKRGPRKSIYAAILRDFLASSETSVLVELPSRTPSNVSIGLRRAIRDAQATASVTQRDGKVFLHL